MPLTTKSQDYEVKPVQQCIFYRFVGRARSEYSTTQSLIHEIQIKIISFGAFDSQPPIPVNYGNLRIDPHHCSLNWFLVQKPCEGC